MEHMTEKEKYKQCDKEAIIAVVIFTAYAVWWYITGYGLWESGNDTWVFGLPLWFVLSSIVGWLICIVVVWFCCRKVFMDFDMMGEADAAVPEEEEGTVVEAVAAELDVEGEIEKLEEKASEEVRS